MPVMEDLVSMVVDAVQAGAVAAVKDSAKSAVTTAWESLKKVISDRYPDVSTAAVEKKPDSPTQRDALLEILRDEGAGEDAELLTAAEALLLAIREHDAASAETVGVDLSRIDAGSIEIERIRASRGSTAVRADDVRTEGKFTIRDVETDGGQPTHPQ
jgi:hypothetical protein